MKKQRGILRKMKSELHSPVDYFLRLNDDEIPLSSYLDKKIRFEFTGHIYCIQCGRKTNKSFQQGHCYPCMQRLNECGNCAIFPEKCQVETGTCPKEDWAHAQCDAPQIVYLANSSGLKVGITRESHVPFRWIDQGAVQAIPIFTAKNRYRCGLIEVALKPFVSDRTNWRTMLKNEVALLDMLVERDLLLEKANLTILKIIDSSGGLISPLPSEAPLTIDYPVLEYPQKITSLSLDKQPDIEGVLKGIKGQYLLLDVGVLNVRKFGGYEVGFTIP